MTGLFGNERYNLEISMNKLNCKFIRYLKAHDIDTVDGRGVCIADTLNFSLADFYGGHIDRIRSDILSLKDEIFWNPNTPKEQKSELFCSVNILGNYTCNSKDASTWDGFEHKIDYNEEGVTTMSITPIQGFEWMSDDDIFDQFRDTMKERVEDCKQQISDISALLDY